MRQVASILLLSALTTTCAIAEPQLQQKDKLQKEFESTHDMRKWQEVKIPGTEKGGHTYVTNDTIESCGKMGQTIDQCMSMKNYDVDIKPDELKNMKPCG